MTIDRRLLAGAARPRPRPRRLRRLVHGHARRAAAATGAPRPRRRADRGPRAATEPHRRRRDGAAARGRRQRPSFAAGAASTTSQALLPDDGRRPARSSGPASTATSSGCRRGCRPRQRGARPDPQGQRQDHQRRQLRDRDAGGPAAPSRHDHTPLQIEGVDATEFAERDEHGSDGLDAQDHASAARTVYGAGDRRLRRLRLPQGRRRCSRSCSRTTSVASIVEQLP